MTAMIFPNHSYHVFVFLLLLLSLATPAWSESVPADTNTDHLQEMYSNRLTFDGEGTPQVGVGLAVDQQEFNFSSDSSMNLTIYNKEGRVLPVITSGPVTVRLLDAKPAQTRAHVVVESIEARDRSNLSPRITDWKQRGLDLMVHRIGSVISLNGDIISNVRYLLTAGAFTSNETARARQRELTKRYGLKSHLFHEMTAPPSGHLQILVEGNVLAESSGMVKLLSCDDKPITAVDTAFDEGFGKTKRESRSFAGMLYVVIGRNGTLTLGNWLGLDDILRGTVPAEIFPSAPMEALKAQAIAARGHLLAKLGTRHLADPFHLCASQHCQVYKGVDSHHVRTDDAIWQTRGQFLMAQGKLVDTVYSANSGGHTENNENVWFQVVDPNLRGRFDGPPNPLYSGGITSSNLDAFLDHPPVTYASKSGYGNGHHRWTRTIDAATLTQKLDAKQSVGRIQALVPLRRGVSGRIIDLKIQGDKGETILTGELKIRRLLGNLPSALIRIGSEPLAAPYPERFVIKGAGFGHGAGMCQTGAIGRAKAGQTAAQILSAYYGKAASIKLLY